MVHPDAAGRMTAYFHDAGLKRPTIFCETPVGAGPDSPLYGWLACTLRSVLPQLEGRPYRLPSPGGIRLYKDSQAQIIRFRMFALTRTCDI
jgi:hypothetical protein